MHGHRGGRVSQGAIYALQTWEACSGSQDKHTKNIHRTADSTGFDTCFYIHTHISNKSQRYYPLQVQYIFNIYLLKHRYNGNNDHSRETWIPEHAWVKVRCE